MTSTKKQDANQTAARVVAETVSKHTDALPADLDAAWERWIAGIQGVDARAKLLLRAVFEAGVEAVAHGDGSRSGT
jgi:hypothetical protein